jgi:hypothetical protein
MNPLGSLYSVEFVLLLGSAIFYYKAAEIDKASQPLLWAGLSAAVFVLTWRVLGWGLIGDVFGQIMVAVGIAIGRVLMERSGKG